MNRKVVIGLLGASLDRGEGPDRWNQWRPTVALCQHEDQLVHRLELLYEKKFEKLANAVTEDIKAVSPETDVRHHRIDFEDPWDFEHVFGELYDFARDYPFNTDDEDYLVHISTGTHVAQICLFLLTESRHFPAQLLQTSPPRRRHAGGPGAFKVIDLDLSCYDPIAQRFNLEQRESLDYLKSGIATRNPGFNRMIEQIEHIAIHARDPILLTGPTGAGKTQLARRIYELKQRRRQIEGQFVEINCATIRGDTAMSTLFGHKRGAYTGASTDRKGLLLQADGGLVFLDEVGELGLDEQAMLLRALELKRFMPLGSDTEVESDFQLICGTNRDLADAVNTGRFRDDLLARINLWTFRMPGLAERRDDIEPNVIYELEQVVARTGRQVRFNREAERRFMDFASSAEASWSANFRDLNAAISRMVTMSPGGRINLVAVEDEITRLHDSWLSCDSPDSDDVLKEVLGLERVADLDLFTRVQLTEVIRVCRRSDSLSDAGRKLFAVSRTQRKKVNDADRLRKYLQRFDLTWSDVRQEQP